MQHTTLSRLIRQEFYRKRLQYRRDAIPGGLGDTAEASDFDRQQVAKGIKVEMEHTSDPRVALEITLDHLRENPRYYDELATLKLSRALSMEFDRLRYAKFVESEHLRDEEGKFTGQNTGSHVRMLNPQSVLFRETGQSHEDVDALSKEVGDGPIDTPVMAYTDKSGNVHIIDGHHRALVARRKGIELPAIVIPEDRYKELREEGYDDTQIKTAHAREVARNKARL